MNELVLFQKRAFATKLSYFNWNKHGARSSTQMNKLNIDLKWISVHSKYDPLNIAYVKSSSLTVEFPTRY